MEITGKIIAVLPSKSGTSAKTGNSWMTQEYVIETQGEHPHKCVFSIFGEDRIKQSNITVGEELTAYFDIEAREYNGKWYNDVKAYKVAKAQPAPTAYYTAQTPPPQQRPNSDSESLPF